MKRETIEKIFKFLEKKEGKELPNHWNIIERLETHPYDVQFRYEGDLNLNNSNITKLPNDLHVDGYLNLSDTSISELPNDLYVDEALILENCIQLTELPDNLHVGRWLDIRGCDQLTELPNNLYVGDDLYVYNTTLANKYTDEEIREIITSKGGAIIGGIYTS